MVAGTLFAQSSPGGADAFWPEGFFPPDAELSLIPAENRPPSAPAADIQIAQAQPSTSVQTAIPAGGSVEVIQYETTASDDSATPGAITNVIEIYVNAEPVQPGTAAPRFSPFSVPLIAELEKGKYYVQIGAYANGKNPVEAELARVGPAYPRAVQNGGSEEKPLYRVLIGPVERTESGSLLQHFRESGWYDAFLRSGN